MGRSAAPESRGAHCITTGTFVGQVDALAVVASTPIIVPCSSFAGTPCDSWLRIDPFEIAHHQEPEIDPWRQARPPHFAGVEILADRFHILNFFSSRI